MADLDDFFAKKDKKRSAKKKFTTSEELVKKLEKAEEKPKKERPVEQEGDANQVSIVMKPNKIWQKLYFLVN